MKKLNKYIMLFVAAFALVSCVDDIVDTPTAESKAGEDVQFGLSLPSARTVYGAENNSALPIYWSDNDKVQIYSPECATGRNDAEYMVTPVSGQSYAEKLIKTDDSGVQWGDKETANFYSVYPSLNADFEGEDSNVTAKLHISNEQKSNAALEGTMFTDMDNVVMYAQTNGVTAGDKVNLTYTPYSTVLSFTLNLGQGTQGWGSAKVNSFTLTAPTGTAIAGDFTLKFNGTSVPTITKAGNNTNSITVTFTTLPVLNENYKTLTFNVPVIPLSDVNISGWTAEVNVTEGTDTTSKTYTKTLGSGALTPGKIHKITLPTIKPQTKWTYNLANWIPTLADYTNIYLTELSLPGAWYAGAKTDDGYQATQSISDLWKAGVRAFAVETKCITGLTIISTPKAAPVDVVVSGTADNAKLMDSEQGNNTLGTGSGKYIYKEGSGNITLKSIFENIITCLKALETDATKKPEFAVLVLSYADGGTTGVRPVDFGAWLELLYDSYNSLSSDYKKYIYSGDITAATTVGDVLKKLVVKINVDANIAQGGYVYQKGLTYTDERTYSYANNLPALFSYNPFMKQVGADYYDTPLFSKMSWKNWSDATDPYRSYTTAITTSDFLWCFSSANRTQVNEGTNTTIPTFAQRQSALRAMITNSRTISAAGTHNVWFYFNAGGTQTTSESDATTSATSFATGMNPWLLEVINLKSNGGTDTNGYYTGTVGTIVESDPSPLGIVMFNQCTAANNAYKGDDIIKAIVEMNDRFKLKRANDPVITDYDATLTTGGNAY